MKLELDKICPQDAPESIKEEVEIIVNIYNILIDNGDNKIEAKKYFLERIKILKHKASKASEEIYNKIHFNYISSN
jgi:hypothetical protein